MKVFSNLEIGSRFIMVRIENHTTGAMLPCHEPDEKPTGRNLNYRCPVFEKISPCYAKNVRDKGGKKKISDVQAVIELER